MSINKIALLGAASSIGLLAACPAFAQQTEPAPTTLVEEVVVTAEKRAQSLQDVPVAVSAFTDEVRETVGITNVQDLANFTPGMAYSTGSDRVTVRGISRFTNNRSSEGGVAIYIDGVYTSSTTAGNLSPLFIERTEVLRGPQGTLYGRNSVGGAINFISKRPTDEFYGEIRLGLSNYARHDIQGAVSDSITDNLRYRVAAVYSDQKEGYFTNLSGPSEGGRGRESAVEVQLEGELMDDKLEWWLKGQWVGWDNLGRGPGGRSIAVTGGYDTSPFITGLVPNGVFGFTGGNTGNIDPFLIDVDTPNAINLDDDQVTFHLTYHLPAFDARYIGGYHAYDYRLETDVDTTSRSTPLILPAGTQFNPAAPLFKGTLLAPAAITPRRVNYYLENPTWQSHEINFASTGDSSTQWIGGLYYFREQSNYNGIDARMPDQPQLATPIQAAFPLVAATPNPDRTYALNSSRNVTWSQAVFGQVDHEFTDEFKVTAGLRYTRDRRRTDEKARLMCFLSPLCANFVDFAGGIPVAVDFTKAVYVDPLTPSPTNPLDPSTTIAAAYNPATGYATRQLRNEWEGVTGTLNADWQPNADTLVYAKYTRGYKAGGFNAGAFPADVTTDSEFINAYEIGWKQTFGGRFQANASAFFYDYRDIQAPLTVFDPIASANRTNFINLPRAEISGFEVETIWYPLDKLQILANYSYLNAEIKQACRGAQIATGCLLDQNNTAAGLQNPIGAELPNSTPHRFSLNANWSWDIEGGEMTASTSYIWRSATYYSIFNQPFNRAGAFGQLDARLLWNDEDDRYTAILFARNLLDDDGHLGAQRPGPPYLSTAQQYTYIQPRTFGIEIQRRFR